MQDLVCIYSYKNVRRARADLTSGIMAHGINQNEAKLNNL